MLRRCRLLMLLLVLLRWRSRGEGSDSGLLVVVVLLLMLRVRKRMLRVLAWWRQRIGRGSRVGRMRVHGSGCTEWLQGETLPDTRRIM